MTIYIVQAAIGGPVKIGYTTSETVTARVAGLQAACPWPLLVLQTLPGTVRDELALHRRFAEYRLHGEWFEPRGALEDWLKASCVEFQQAIEKQSEPLVGPLPEVHAKAFAALVEGGGWLRASQVATLLDTSHMRVSGVLRALHSKYGRIQMRLAVINGRGVCEWRAYCFHRSLIVGDEIAA